MAFAVGLIVADWLIGGDHPTSLASAILALLLVIGGTPLVIALLSFYVVIPMGVVSLWLLRRVGRSLWPEVVAGHITTA